MTLEDLEYYTRTTVILCLFVLFFLLLELSRPDHFRKVSSKDSAESHIGLERQINNDRFFNFVVNYFIKEPINSRNRNIKNPSAAAQRNSRVTWIQLFLPLKRAKRNNERNPISH